MNDASSKEAEKAARFFLRRIDELRKAEKDPEKRYSLGRFNAAVKRASLELTNALILLRRTRL